MRRDRHVPNVQDLNRYSTPQQRTQYAAGLRELADWIEETEFPLHRYALGFNTFTDMSATCEINSTWLDEDPDFAKRAGSAVRLIGGRVEKKADSYSFRLTRYFSGGVCFRFRINRNAVCEEIEVQKTVTKQVPVDVYKEAKLVSAKDELEKQITALETAPKTVIETVKEYRCPESLLAAGLEDISTTRLP
jgi:hypothetical protein